MTMHNSQHLLTDIDKEPQLKHHRAYLEVHQEKEGPSAEITVVVENDEDVVERTSIWLSPAEVKRLIAALSKAVE